MSQTLKNIWNKVFKSANKPKLEYLMIFQEIGIPIYSQCFGEFCGLLATDQSLMSGFMSALTTIPKMLSDNRVTLESVELSYTKLRFNYTTPSGNVIIIGIDPSSTKEHVETIRNAFDDIEFLIEKEFKQFNWSHMTGDQINKLNHEISKQVIEKYFSLENLNENHHFNCPLCIKQEVEGDMPRITYGMKIWDGISQTYNKIYEFLKRPESQERKQNMEKTRNKWKEKTNGEKFEINEID